MQKSRCTPGLQRQYNLTSLPVRSKGCTYNLTVLPVRSQGCTLTQTPNQDAPLDLSPPSRVLRFYTIYLTRDSMAKSACSRCRVQSPGKFCLPLSCCLATSVVRSRVVSTRLSTYDPRDCPGASLFLRLVCKTVHNVCGMACLMHVSSGEQVPAIKSP